MVKSTEFYQQETEGYNGNLFSGSQTSRNVSLATLAIIAVALLVWLVRAWIQSLPDIEVKRKFPCRRGQV
jgi:hypothetical protein